MRKLTAWLPLAGAALVALAGTGLFMIGMRSQADATRAMTGAVQLRQARLDLAEAQKKLGDSDLEDAIVGAERANAAADRVAALTHEILGLVRHAETTVGDINAVSAGSARSLELSARQTDLVADILGAINGYQGSATDSARTTNAALRKILRALRRTNQEFPGPLRSDDGGAR